MMFSEPTLKMFGELLDQLQLPATHPNLVEVAEVVVKAREELAEACKELPIVVPLAEPSSNGQPTREDSSV